MAPIHTILHATDFSTQAANAFHLACALTRDYNARLVVLHVAIPPVVVYGEGVVPGEPERTFREARAQLNALETPNADVHAERHFATGAPAEEILREAADLGADLIILGTHGRSGLSRLLMGSVAEQVMRRAACPVLTVKTPIAAPVRSRPVEEPAGVFI